jgi:hypothetical protein
MSDKNMLQAIIDGQSAIKEELKKDINKVGKNLLRIEGKVDKNGKSIDKLGLDLAEISDDAPTREEHEKVEERVDKLEKQVATL